MAEFTNRMIAGTLAKLRKATDPIYGEKGAGTRGRTFPDLARCAADLIQWTAYE